MLDSTTTKPINFNPDKNKLDTSKNLVINMLTLLNATCIEN